MPSYDFPRSIIIQDPVTLTSGPEPAAVVGQPYSHQYVASGGGGSYVFSLAPGSALPAGLMLSSNGLLSGTPAASGTFNFTLRVDG